MIGAQGSAINILKFLIIFEHDAPHFHFVLGPAMMQPLLFSCFGFLQCAVSPSNGAFGGRGVGEAST